MIKNVNINLILLLISTLTFGQTTYLGKIVDSEKNSIVYADVVAYNTNNHELITGAVSDENGEFEIPISSVTPFYFEIIYLGYETKVINPVSTDLGIITLFETESDLEELVITTKQKVIEQKIDRMVFNVENSISSNGGTALDVLKITPGVQVNNDDISIVGKQGVRVLINDRIVQLSNSELVTYLSSFSADDIKNIEVITTPPAKYDAEGNAGLINIVLKKIKENSWSNQIRSSFVQTTYSAVNLGNTFNYNHNKWKVFTSINGKKGHEQSKTRIEINYPNGLWRDTLVMKKTEDYLTAKLGIDYDLSQNSSLGIFYSGNYKTPNAAEHSNTNIFNFNNKLVGEISNKGFTKEITNNQSLNIHYLQNLDTLGKQMAVDFDYFNYQNNKDREFSSERMGDFNTFQKSNNTGNQNISNYSAKVDLVHPSSFANFTYGARVAQTKTDNDVKFYDLTNVTPILDSKKSNIFRYTENIHALYIDASKAINSQWQSKVGLRVENTQTEGFSETSEKPIKQEYLRIFPTAYLNYIKNQDNIFNITYSKRIGRPSFFRLNPFRFYINANSYVVGNPNLKPVITDFTEFNYIFKNKFITNLFFSKESGSTGQISMVDVENNKQIYTFKNIGDAYIYGLKQTVLYNPFKWWNTTNMLATFCSDIKMNERIDFGSEVIKGWSYQFYTNQVFLLNQEGTIQAEATFFVNSKGYRLVYESQPFYSLDLGFKMQFLDRKLQLSVKANDVFRSSTADVFTYTNGVKQVYNSYNDNRYFTLGLTYKFGNDKIKVNERNKGNQDEINRVN